MHGLTFLCSVFFPVRELILKRGRTLLNKFPGVQTVLGHPLLPLLGGSLGLACAGLLGEAPHPASQEAGAAFALLMLPREPVGNKNHMDHTPFCFLRHFTICNRFSDGSGALRASPLLTTHCLTGPLFSWHLNTSILNMIN